MVVNIKTKTLGGVTFDTPVTRKVITGGGAKAGVGGGEAVESQLTVGTSGCVTPDGSVMLAIEEDCLEFVVVLFHGLIFGRKFLLNFGFI